MSGMKSWSTTAANNVLANTGFTMDEGQAPNTVNDSVRQLMADVRTEWAQGANIAAAATVDLSTATGGYVTITGSGGPITSFATVSAGIRRKLLFTGAPTITHNATSLISPTGASIVAVAGDCCEVMSEGSGNWRILWYAGRGVQATSINASGNTVLAGTLSVGTTVITSGTVVDVVSGLTSTTDLVNLVQKIASNASGADTTIQFTDRVAHNGFISMKGGDMRIFSESTLAATFSGTTVKPAGLLDLTTATAGQIGFPATQNASAGANVLDDYEEGTWTPSVGGSATYTTQTGTYTKIGRLVYIDMVLTINAIGTGSTTVISGLPFVSAQQVPFATVSSGDATAVVTLLGMTSIGASTISMRSRTAASSGEGGSAIFQNATSVQLCGSYSV